MKLVNESRKFVISVDVGIANSLFSRIRGLMFSKPRDLVLISPKEDISSSSIHMLFMSYSIDVVWLNSRKEVVDIKRRISPFNPLKLRTWRIYRPEKKARYVVELGRGNLGTTEVGDKIGFIK